MTAALAAVLAIVLAVAAPGTAAEPAAPAAADAVAVVPAAADAAPETGADDDDAAPSGTAVLDGWYGPLAVHDVAMVFLGASMLLAVIRLVRGPTLADRVVALDLLAFFAAGIVAIAAVLSERSEVVMVAVVVALLTFMGTAAFALYLERRGREDAD